MAKYDVRASDGDGSYGSFDSLEATERALSMVTRRMDPEAQIIVKRDWRDRAQAAEAEVERLTAALAKREADYMGLWEHSQEYMLRSRGAEAEAERLTAALWACRAMLAASERRIEKALALLLPDTTGRSVPGDVRGATTFPCCQHCPPDGSIHGLHFMSCVECAMQALRGES